MEDPAADAAAPLREAWYYAAPGREVGRGRTIARIMLGEKVLLGRDRAGAVFALRDICPHRGMPLSFGAFDGTEIECCYHGWRFATDGRCTAIPSLVPGQAFDLARIAVARYPAREVQGNIWVYFGSDPGTAPDIPVPDIPMLEGFAESAAPQADGPGARPLCPQRVVVALAPLGARKGEGVRALALWLHDEPARPVH